MTFPDYIEKKYIQWLSEQGQRRSVAEFAAFLGISQPLLSMWMNGTKKPGLNNIKLLAQIFGLEVYDVVGLPRPDEDLHYIQTNWDLLPPDVRRSIKQVAEKYVTTNERTTQNLQRRKEKA